MFEKWGLLFVIVVFFFIGCGKAIYWRGSYWPKEQVFISMIVTERKRL